MYLLCILSVVIAIGMVEDHQEKNDLKLK